MAKTDSLVETTIEETEKKCRFPKRLFELFETFEDIAIQTFDEDFKEWVRPMALEDVGAVARVRVVSSS